MRHVLLATLLMGFYVASIMAGELSAFRIEHPKSGAIAFIDREIWFVSEPVNAETVDARFDTATVENGDLQIYVSKDSLKLAIDDKAKEFALTTRQQPTMNWKWAKVGARGDTRICHLEVVSDKYKGRLLGVDDKPVDVVRKKNGKSVPVLKLKLVETPDKALKFHVYPLSK